MFPKLVVVVLALGAMSSALLAFRQSRLQAASDLAQTQLRISAADDRLWMLRAKVAERITPHHVKDMADRLGPMRPLAPYDPELVPPAESDAPRTPVVPGPGSRRAAKPDAKPDAKPTPSTRPGAGPTGGQTAKPVPRNQAKPSTRTPTEPRDRRVAQEARR